MTRQIVLIDIGDGMALDGVLPSAVQGAAYSAFVLARGGAAPYTYTLTSGESVLTSIGISLDRNTGEFTAADVLTIGSFPLTVRATDITGAFVERSFVISVTGVALVVTQMWNLSGTVPFVPINEYGDLPGGTLVEYSDWSYVYPVLEITTSVRNLKRVAGSISSNGTGAGFAVLDGPSLEDAQAEFPTWESPVTDVVCTINGTSIPAIEDVDNWTSSVDDSDGTGNPAINLYCMTVDVKAALEALPQFDNGTLYLRLTLTADIPSDLMYGTIYNAGAGGFSQVDSP